MRAQVGCSVSGCAKRRATHTTTTVFLASIHRGQTMNKVMQQDGHTFYEAILQVFNNNRDSWLSSVDIQNHSSIMEFASAFEDTATYQRRISNNLGNLWRRGLIKREASLKHGKMDGSRYSYCLTDQDADTVTVVRDNMVINDDGKNLIINIPGYKITIEKA